MGNHRADRRGPKRAAATPAAAPVTVTVTTPARATGGRRKATRPSRPIVKVPAAPTLIGAVALLTAAGGAVGLGQDTLRGSSLELSAGSSAIGKSTAAILAERDPRARAISRDSERQALKDAAEASLKAAAEEQSEQRNAALASLAKDAEARADEIAKNLWVVPLAGYHLTARFGQVGLWASSHTGLDFAGPYGTPLVAVANGVITDSGYDGSYGLKTVMTLADGTEIWYCHQSATGVSVGEKVVQGQQIGNLGSTGHVTGPHLHLEVRPGGGDPIDPYYALLQHGVNP